MDPSTIAGMMEDKHVLGRWAGGTLVCHPGVCPHGGHSSAEGSELLFGCGKGPELGLGVSRGVSAGGDDGFCGFRQLGPFLPMNPHPQSGRIAAPCGFGAWFRRMLSSC